MEMDKLIFFRSLGCNKNTIDSEIMMSLLIERGYRITQKPAEAAHIIVNTCAFIDDAKQEAIDTILELSQYKKKGARLIVAGCFSQLHYSVLKSEMPEVDAIIGIGDLCSIVDVVENPSFSGEQPQSRKINSKYREYTARKEFLSFPGSAYIKISEGCSRNCSFCTIPKIRGKLRSRDIHSIVEEAITLESNGMHELVLVSQDTLGYGSDLHLNDGLNMLIGQLLQKTSSPYFRLLYLRPDMALIKSLDVFKHTRVLPYFDVPIQHVSENILMSMNREGGRRYFSDIFNRIRQDVPEAVLRTTVIVGYPGESEKEFNELCEFIEGIQFDHLGVFIFSPQRYTTAFKLKKKVKRSVAEVRRRILLDMQRNISHNNLKKNVGNIFHVIIEEKFEGKDLYIGRSYHFAPEVDGVFLVSSQKKLFPGNLVRARVTRADDYDLHGFVFNS
jgi:ribosomal protein S12 methylthiotransferase